MSTPFERLTDKSAAAEDKFVKVRSEDLRLAVKFLKYHRQWRLYDGHVALNKIANDVKMFNKINKYRLKYYAELYDVDMDDVVEAVTIYMRDALHLGGNTEDPKNVLESYLNPVKYRRRLKSVQNIRRRREKSKVRKLQKQKRRNGNRR